MGMVESCSDSSSFLGLLTETVLSCHVMDVVSE